MTDLQSRWARALVDALVQAGVRDVVISPGSRSTPFVIAAAAHPGLACHDVIDERSAAFFGLGQARATGRPSVLLCTSGTAAAHYYPAIIEASQAFLPLLVLSADRPFELQHCGANQTVDQVKLFGGHVRHFADLGMPDGSTSSFAALRRSAVQAVSASRSPVPGPVHIDVHARKPLEPARGPELVAAPAVDGPVTQVHPQRATPAPSAVRAVCDLLASTDRGVLVAGPAPPAQRQARDAVFDLARRTGWPLCAEATSQLRLARATGVPRFDAFDWVWRSEKGRAPLRPEAVIQLGGAPTSAGYERLIAEEAIRRVVVAPYGWPDPASTAEALACADAGPMASAVLESMGPDAARGEGAWARRLARLDGAVWGAVDKVAGASEGALDEAGVAGEVARACDGRAALMVGNSLPVRHLDAWVRGGAADVEVVSQRGASGIDGLVSGAAGYAAASRKPTVLLVGDVSFLHDLGGLAVARRVDVSLVLVVINNGGGRIFEQLPLGDREDLAAHLGHFTTPHAASLRHAAGTFGHAYARPEDRAALREAIGSALGRGGTTLVEAVVRPHGAAEQRRRVHTEVERVLGEHGEQP